MPYETVRYEVDESILTITLNRPDKLNAFTTQMLHEMIDAFDRADKDDAIRAVIVHRGGAGVLRRS
jgi:enoyl-CoA hydratase/carnithine racemase